MWKKANPSLGITVGIDKVKEACESAKQNTVVPFGQGFKDMLPPTKELMKLVIEQKIAHGGHHVLRWMMDNIFIRTDPAGNIKADKEKST